MNKLACTDPQEGEASCPCVVASEPCHPRCTCIKPYSSRGCMCCVKYGSKEQVKASADRIVSACRSQRPPNVTVDKE